MYTCLQMEINIMPITVRLSNDEEARLGNLAAQTGRKVSFYVKHAISEYLEDMEDLYLAEQSMIRVRSGQERTYTMKEVEAALGLGD
jgi:RHH-type transcriptional regulator, rel operon repressor / antitoxin RelB